MTEPFHTHVCSGPSIYSHTTPDVHTIYNKCTVCGVEWAAMVINLNSIRKLKMTNETPEPVEQPDDPRHPAVVDILKYFKYDHLPPHLQEVSKQAAEFAHKMAEVGSGAELTVGLRKLLEAKDCFVRSLIK
jgi:hypothetical protein